MTKKGDNGSGSGGSWEVKDKVVICCDHIGSPSQDNQMMQDIANIISIVNILRQYFYIILYINIIYIFI